MQTTLKYFGGAFAFSGFVESHIHLDRACILGHCRICEGTLAEALTTLRETNVLDDETVRALEKSIADFKPVFRTSSGQSLAEQFEALDEAEIQQEQLVVKK